MRPRKHLGRGGLTQRDSILPEQRAALPRGGDGAARRGGVVGQAQRERVRQLLQRLAQLLGWQLRARGRSLSNALSLLCLLRRDMAAQRACSMAGKESGAVCAAAMSQPRHWLGSAQMPRETRSPSSSSTYPRSRGAAASTCARRATLGA